MPLRWPLAGRCGTPPGGEFWESRDPSPQGFTPAGTPVETRLSTERELRSGGGVVSACAGEYALPGTPDIDVCAPCIHIIHPSDHSAILKIGQPVSMPKLIAVCLGAFVVSEREEHSSKRLIKAALFSLTQVARNYVPNATEPATGDMSITCA